MLRKFNLNTTLIKCKFENHKNIKEHLIKLIDSQKAEKVNTRDEYYEDNISQTDWKNATDLNLPWKQYFLPYFENTLKNACTTMGFEKFDLTHLWFQKYNKGGYHNWHVHGSNYTGVYYLNLPKGSALTKLLDGFNLSNILSYDTEEGDMIFFPSHIIHKGEKQLLDENKIIISWNIQFHTIQKNLLNYLNGRI
jgi:hypothetical protein